MVRRADKCENSYIGVHGWWFNVSDVPVEACDEFLPVVIVYRWKLISWWRTCVTWSRMDTRWLVLNRRSMDARWGSFSFPRKQFLYLGRLCENLHTSIWSSSLVTFSILELSLSLVSESQTVLFAMQHLICHHRPGHLQTTLSKLLPTVCSGQLSLLPSPGREMSSSLRATGWRPSVADWGSGMSVCCTAGPIVHYRGQWMAA